MRIDHQSRISFAIDFYDDEEEAEREGQKVRDAGETRNGGFYHGQPCGRDPAFDAAYADGKKGYAVTRA